MLHMRKASSRTGLHSASSKGASCRLRSVKHISSFKTTFLAPCYISSRSQPRLTALRATLTDDAEQLAVQQAQHRQAVLQETCDFLASDLKKIFLNGDITSSRYADNIVFEDPITKYTSKEGYVFNLKLLRTLFNIKFNLHAIKVTSSDEVTARWTMAMDFWLLPWRPEITFTGRTVYKVNPDTGIVLSHTDYWDAIDQNGFLSLEGVQHVLRQFLQVQLTPSIETPKYTVVKKLKEYEIRRYEPYLVAETDMGSATGPASGVGFNELAGYIFGSNQENMKMEMTTPVFTNVTPGAPNPSMQFVMENRYTDVSQLPTPKVPTITPKQEQARYVAAVKFSGWPLDFEVLQQERALRDMLLRDGLRPVPGYQLARYNDPTVPPMLRRNEVLINLEGYQWPPAL